MAAFLIRFDSSVLELVEEAFLVVNSLVVNSLVVGFSVIVAAVEGGVSMVFQPYLKLYSRWIYTDHHCG